MVKESDQLDLREENGVKDLIFFVNGQKRVIKSGTIDSRMTLAVYLRDHLRLTGTKIGCNEGGCGACTVMISDQHPLTKELRHYSVNACLMPICAVFGKAITTVEGISTERALHPVQERLAKCHGSQCGYCTPGFVMAMYSLLRNHPKPSIEQIDDTIQGNLCHCTGYRPILEAFYSFAEVKDQNNLSQNGVNSYENGCPMGIKCCKNQENGESATRKTVKKFNNKRIHKFLIYSVVRI